MLRKLILLGVCAALVVSCNNSQQKKTDYDLETVTISMKRTACLGPCPEYEVHINGDGSVAYNGGQHTAQKGVDRFQVSRETVEELVDSFYAKGFWEMEDRYDGGAAVVTEQDNGSSMMMKKKLPDLPTTMTTIKVGDKGKTVTNYQDAPAALKELEAAIDKLIDRQKRVGR